jgi:hypothetical protein
MAIIQSRLRLSAFRSDELIKRAPQILKLYGRALDQQLKEEIRKPQFDWPGETRRYGALLRATNLRTRAKIRNAQGGLPYVTVGSPRNIVDTGNFLRSQKRKQVNQATIRFTWGDDRVVTYAGAIYQGIPGRNYPARDWIKPALDALPIGEFFAREWRRLQNTAGL